jgi:hypothetical protein
MSGETQSPGGLFVPAPRPVPAPSRMSASGLVLPGVPSTAWMPGVTPAPEGYEWLGNLLGVYLPAREYLGLFEAARGRVFDRDAWVRVLLARFPAEEYLCQLAILNHAATSDELTAPFVERFLDRIALDAAETVRRAMAGGIDGFRRSFLARQLVLRAVRMVLVPPPAATGGPLDPALEASLAGIDQETAAVLLVHLAGDALCQERQPGEARSTGTAESLAMEMNANSLFNDRDDNGDLLARYRMLWLDYGTRLKRYTPRMLPADMLREAAGIGLDEMIALAFAYWGYLQGRGPGDPVRVKAMAAEAMTIPRADVETFLGLSPARPPPCRRSCGSAPGRGRCTRSRPGRCSASATMSSCSTSGTWSSG